MALTSAQYDRMLLEMAPHGPPRRDPKPLRAADESRAAWKRAANLCANTWREAFMNGHTTAEAIRDRGVTGLLELAESASDEKVRAMANNALATLGAAEMRVKEKSQGSQEEQLIASLTDDELVDLKGLIERMRAERKAAGK